PTVSRRLACRHPGCRPGGLLACYNEWTVMLSATLAGRTPALPLLITGITGVAGYNALHYFQQRFPGQVFGIRPVQTWGLRGEGIFALNAEDRAGLGGLFRSHRFRSVLNATGNCALKSCELDPAMAQQLNIASAAAVVANAVEYGCRLV